MKIDRTRFLLLASSLAAASAAAVVSTTGCNTVTKDDADSGPTTEGTGDSGPTTEGGDSGPTTEGGDAAAEAGKCLGDSPDGGPNCDPEADGGPAKCAGLLCQSWSPRFKTEVASAIFDCLQTAPTCEDSTCAGKVLPLACPDPTSDAYCTPLVAACASTDGGAFFTQSVCVTVANGLSESGRTQLSSCIAEGAGDCQICLDTINTTL